MASDTTLIIKNPSRSNQHFSISFRLDGTIADLQKVLSETYEGRPAPADQTLIYGGKVLKDSSVRLRDIVSKHDAPEGPHSIHLVIKHKPWTSLASPARSVDSSASVSRAPSMVNAPASSGATRPVPPPTRTMPAPAAAPAAAGAGPSSSYTPRTSRTQAVDPAPAPSSAASQADPDDLEAAAASFLNSWAAFSGTSEGLYGGAFGGYPFARPAAAAAGTAAPDATAAATAGQDGSSAAAAAATAAAAAPAAMMPYMYYNPIIGGAYQAAYSAALAALSVASQQPLAKQEQQPGLEPGKASAGLSQEGQGGAAAGGSSGSGGEAAERAAPAAGTAAAAAGAPAAATAQGVQQYAYVPVFVPAYGQVGYPFGMPGPYAFPQPGRRNPLGQPPPWQVPAGHAGVDADLGHLTALLDALEGMPAPAGAGRRPGGRGHEAGANQGGAAGREGQRLGIRLRRGQVLVLGPNGPIAAGEQQPAGGAAAAARNRAWRPRVFTIRITTRGLLQALVFAIVLYQHFTWRRFLALLIGGAVLFITNTWAPFRRLMRGIHAMPGPGPARPAAGAGAGAAAPAAGVAAGAEGAAAGAGQQAPAAAVAEPQQQQPPQRRGFLYEILVFIVGFITSLLPAWNFNPDDAAAFAAGQEMVAAEERVRQQQEAAAAPADGEAAPAEGAEGAGAGQAPGANGAPERAAAAAAAGAPGQ